jgi:transcriptional antiterminator RfaH
MMQWYLLYTKVHAERQLASHLTHLGYEAYLPTIPVVQPRRDRPVDKPFFPGYVFIHYDLEALGIGRLAYTPGLRSIVMFGGEPAVVPDADVARIREQLAKQQQWDKRGVPLRHGDAVEILSESFQGVDAVFDRTLTPNERVRVFLRYLEEHRLERKRVERLIPLELDAHLVRKKAARD